MKVWKKKECCRRKKNVILDHIFWKIIKGRFSFAFTISQCFVSWFSLCVVLISRCRRRRRRFSFFLILKLLFFPAFPNISRQSVLSVLSTHYMMFFNNRTKKKTSKRTKDLMKRLFSWLYVVAKYNVEVWINSTKTHENLFFFSFSFVEINGWKKKIKLQKVFWICVNEESKKNDREKEKENERKKARQRQRPSIEFTDKVSTIFFVSGCRSLFFFRCVCYVVVIGIESSKRWYSTIQNINNNNLND